MAGFPSRYAGICPDCGEWFPVGTQVEYREMHSKPVHFDCDAEPASEPTSLQHPVCQVCWLVHPPGACDR